MSAKKKLYIKTWGCQMNVYDSRRMADVLEPLGYVQCDEPEGADMIILNTCHIREKATHKVFSEIGRLAKFKKRKGKSGGKMLLAVAGCVAQAEGEFIMKRTKHVDMVFGPQAYHTLPEMVAKASGERVVNTEFLQNSKFDSLPCEGKHSGVSAFLSIQEGCDRFCTYCVVPYTRGAEFSRPVRQVVDDVCRLRDAGVKEVTLLGQNVNAYHGVDEGGRQVRLGELMAMVAEIDGIERIRYVTSHPCDMADDLVDAHAGIEKLMPYIHLPPQSGSDQILKAMNRKHTAQGYIESIESLRKARPDIAVSGDFIVGFPGESDQDFEDTMELVKRVGFASAYSFRFSARPGTPAAKMGKAVDDGVASERLARLQELLTTQQLEFNRSKIGEVLPVLFEGFDRSSNKLQGKSPYNQVVNADVACGDEAAAMIGEIAGVKIGEASANSLAGVVKDT